MSEETIPFEQGREVIAVTGKGGAGKTTLVALMAKILSDRDHRILAIDADPPVSLTYALGAEPDLTLGKLRAELIEDPRERREIGDRHIRDVIMERAVIRLERMNLLILGQAEGPGCYCGLNELLKFGIESMAKNYGITLIDCEAGIEQINRRVISSISTLITVSDATLKGLRTALYLKAIASKYGLTGRYRTGVVINRVGKGAAEFEEKARSMGLDVLGLIPSDENVADFDRLGRPTADLPHDSPSVLAVGRILTRLGLTV